MRLPDKKRQKQSDRNTRTLANMQIIMQSFWIWSGVERKRLSPKPPWFHATWRTIYSHSSSLFANWPRPAL